MDKLHAGDRGRRERNVLTDLASRCQDRAGGDFFAQVVLLPELEVVGARLDTQLGRGPLYGSQNHTSEFWTTRRDAVPLLEFPHLPVQQPIKKASLSTG